MDKSKGTSELDTITIDSAPKNIVDSPFHEARWLSQIADRPFRDIQ